MKTKIEMGPKEILDAVAHYLKRQKATLVAGYSHIRISDFLANGSYVFELYNEGDKVSQEKIVSPEIEVEAIEKNKHHRLLRVEDTKEEGG